MKNLLLMLAQLLATIAKLPGPGGAKAINDPLFLSPMTSELDDAYRR